MIDNGDEEEDEATTVPTYQRMAFYGEHRRYVATKKAYLMFD
jgi:hypothetical protein